MLENKDKRYLKSKKKLNKDLFGASRYVSSLNKDMSRFVNPKQVLNLDDQKYNILFSNNEKYTIGLAKRSKPITEEKIIK